MTWLSEWWSGGTAVIEPASPRDAARLAQLHGASFHRGWGESEFEGMLAERNTLVHRLRMGREIVGFAVSRMAADEAEILSIAIAPGRRGRGLSRNLLLTHLGHLAAACVLCSSRSRITISRRGGSTSGPDLASPGAASAITGRPTGNN